LAGRGARALVLHRIAAAQIETVDAEVVFCQNLSFFSRAQLDRLRAAGRRVVGQIAAPLPPWDIVKGFDFVLTSFPHFVPRLRDRGVDSAYLKLAFDERLPTLVPESDPESARAHDVVFVGGVNPAIHPAGTALLERVCATRSVAVFGYGAEALPSSSPILRNYKGEAWGLEMYRALAAAKIALNRHIDVAEGHANNMRLYEATGMGAALLTERAANLVELFEPDREVATYDNADQLLTQIDLLLADEDRRRDIARAGHRRTLREHTWANRIAELARMLEKRL
jgi:spore maturation protein CgeB